MKNRKLTILVVIFIFMLILLSACAAEEEEAKVFTIEATQMKAICELAVMDCYYHNVAKYNEEDASGALWWKKDKKFWIEYSGIVSIGIDASLLELSVNNDLVTISMPKAKVLSSKVDETTLTEESFIVDKDSAEVNAEDQTYAFAEAQAHLETSASTDDSLLAEAERRVQLLLGDYVANIGELMGVEYTIEWKIID